MILKTYQIDAFATKVFEGNPAMVVPLKRWLDDDLMQKIAVENNLSETAFFMQKDELYELRWFTPKGEVDMCGHATLASAYVLFECLDDDKEEIVFATKSGHLKVYRDRKYFVMDFPVQEIKSSDKHQKIEEAFAIKPLAVFESMDYIVVFENEVDIINTTPDFALLKELDLRGVCITAKSKKYDFVTRFFAPKYGIEEDPVTGSAFTQLVSYWQSELGKDVFFAKQLSRRGGEVGCTIKGDRVKISGEAVKYLEGTIYI